MSNFVQLTMNGWWRVSSVNDDIGLASLALRIDSTNLTETHTLSVAATSFDWTPTEEGLYVLTLNTVETAGNTAVVYLVVLVGNDTGSYDTGHDQGSARG
ncbi:MAG: hypothetical protein HXY34_12410 [Candidatus Thorarchaeota archaeon]|nr:hypothetical protein [Candidatus Thorarchaeota archaeon]